MKAGARTAGPLPGPARLIFAAAVAVAAIAAGSGDARAFWLGWLAAWLYCLAITVGASVWLLIGALTGGRWITAAAPLLRPLSRMTWMVALFGLLFVLAGPVLFPWWHSGGEGHQALWLNRAFFGLRSLGVLLLWSSFSFLAPEKLSASAAALALLAHAVAISLAGVDWVLSLEPTYVSTSFGAHLAVLQLGLAIASVALAGPASGARPDGDESRASGEEGDIGGLLLACVLGVFYLAGMAYVVDWSGNQPQDAAWYLVRLERGGRMISWLAFCTGVLVPFVLLLFRRQGRPLRWAGAAGLLGGMFHLLWLVAPGRFLPATALGFALVAAVASAAFLIGGRRLWPTR